MGYVILAIKKNPAIGRGFIIVYLDISIQDSEPS